MTNLFKKTFVAVAVASLSSAAFADAEVTTVKVAVSAEASASATNIPTGNITVKLGAEYAVGDIVTFTVTNGSANRLSWPNNLTVPGSVTQTTRASTTVGDPAVILTRTAIKEVVLGRLSNTENGATYRVTSVVNPTLVATPNSGQTAAGDKVVPVDTFTTNNAVINPFTIQLKRDVVVANNLTSITFAAQTATGVTLDTAGSKLSGVLTVSGETYYDGIAAQMGSVFGQGTNLGPRRIDIGQSRRAFITGTTSNTVNAKDTASLVVGKDTKAYEGPRDTTGIAFAANTTDDVATFEVNGDFSWVKDIKKYENSISVSGTGCEFKEDTGVTAKKLIIEDTDSSDLSCQLTLDLADGLGRFAPAVIEPQAFTYSMSVAYKDTGSTYPTPSSPVDRVKVLATDAALGSWILNAYSAEVNYMPYGDGISQILYFTNKGGTVGKIFADVWTTAGTKVLSNQEVGVTVANGKTMLSGTVRDALAAKGVTSDRVRIRLVAEVPASQGAVYSAYNVSGDRIVSY